MAIASSRSPTVASNSARSNAQRAQWAPWPGDRPPPSLLQPFPLALLHSHFHPLTRLTRKLLRDLYALKTQALAVAACDVLRSGHDDHDAQSDPLARTARDHYYRDYRFAQVFARLKRAPNRSVTNWPPSPAWRAPDRISLQVTLDLPDSTGRLGLVNSLPEYGELELNRLHLRRGRMLVGPAERARCW